MRWTRDDIVAYYKANELAYGLWGSDMHFGYWDKATKCLRPRHLHQATQRFNQVLAERAHIGKSDHVLDAGCGVGGACIYLARTFGCRATGITICPRQVTKAQKKAAEHGVAELTEFHEMDYHATAFPDNTFDVVWGLESICYADKARFIREAYRILKSGGRLIVADGFASREHYEGADEKLMTKWLDGWIVNDLETPRGFSQHAVETGFHNVDYRDVTEHVFLTSRLMYFVSFLFIHLHMLNKVVTLKPYPTDALYHQYKAMKQGLWQYGIFYGEKQAKGRSRQALYGPGGRALQ